ncbi:MAG TPA: hypothetical protein VN642_12675 [Dongiaceae bacterium]|nr:hypothetical protein [Dongiaceae bacterium]
MEKRGMNRREFLLVAGGATAALPLVALLTGCGGGSSSTPAAALANGDFIVTSVTSSLTTHTHTITVKAADLAAGVQVVYTTSSAGTTPHTHTVTITPAQITSINAGNAVTVISSTDFTHSHDFDIKKP